MQLKELLQIPRFHFYKNQTSALRLLGSSGERDHSTSTRMSMTSHHLGILPHFRAVCGESDVKDRKSHRLKRTLSRRKRNRASFLAPTIFWRLKNLKAVPEIFQRCMVVAIPHCGGLIRM